MFDVKPDPELAEIFRQAREARRKEREDNEKRNIYSGSPQTAQQLQADIISGKGRWRPLGMLEWEKEQAEKKRIAEGEELVIVEEPIF
jgi:hypothetical protein